MRRVVILASTLASGIACVSLEVPDQVAECRAAGACYNLRSDASPDESQRDVPTFAGRTDGPRDAEATMVDSKDGPRDADAVGGLCDVPASAPTNVVTSGDKQLGLFW